MNKVFKVGDKVRIIKPVSAFKACGILYHVGDSSEILKVTDIENVYILSYKTSDPNRKINDYPSYIHRDCIARDTSFDIQSEFNKDLEDICNE